MARTDCLLVDTNVLLDVLQEDPEWADWSQYQLELAATRYSLQINPVIYAELSSAFDQIEDLEVVLDETGLQVAEIPREALFLAGRIFLRYRRAGGRRSGVLPDFFIGAHASVLGVPLLTRDRSRYPGYFPRLALITP